MKFASMLTLFILLSAANSNCYADCKCDDWVERGGYCVDYVKSKIPTFPVPQSVAEITVLKNREVAKAEEGDVAIFDLGRYWHVAYIEKVNRNQVGQAVSVDVSEMNYGGKLSFNLFKNKWKQNDEQEWKRALCCGVTSKYDQLDTRKNVAINSIEQIWSPDIIFSQEQSGGYADLFKNKIREALDQLIQLKERVL